MSARRGGGGGGSARLAKYLAYARLGFRQARAEPGEVLGRMFFFVMILGVFSAIWRAVAEAAPGERNPRTMLWYLAMTEWVLMSAPNIQFQIEDDIRRGDVAYQIARPVSWIGARFAHGLGGLAFRAPLLLVTACVVATFFAGRPEHPGRLVVAIAFGLVAAAVMVVFNLLLGMIAFWLGDIMPAFWIWQKLAFVLGGLLLPLQFYPDLFIRVAKLTPFPALVGAPASLVTGEPLWSMAGLAVALVVWMAVGLGIARVAFGRATQRLQLNGG